MKRLLLVAFLISVTACYGQTVNKLSTTAGLEAFVPLSGLADNTLKDNYYGGVGETLQLEYDASKVVTTTLTSGFYYIINKPEHQPVIQLPVLMGLKFHLAPALSFHQTGGISYVNQGLGFRFMYTSGVVLEYERLSADMKFLSTITDSHQGAIMGIGARLAYRF